MSTLMDILSTCKAHEVKKGGRKDFCALALFFATASSSSISNNLKLRAKNFIFK